MALEINQKAPEFKALLDDGREIKLKDYRGEYLVLYFYPKDNTSGCTKEACDFRDNMKSVTSSGASVLGVSPDSVKSHDNFKTKFNLNFNLVADPDKTICNLYGVYGVKSLYGKKYMGVLRTTFIIDDKGIIKYIFEKVKVEGHVAEVLVKVKELQKQK